MESIQAAETRLKMAELARVAKQQQAEIRANAAAEVEAAATREQTRAWERVQAAETVRC
jgi:hypothetical protein